MFCCDGDKRCLLISLYYATTNSYFQKQNDIILAILNNTTLIFLCNEEYYCFPYIKGDAASSME